MLGPVILSLRTQADIAIPWADARGSSLPLTALQTDHQVEAPLLCDKPASPPYIQHQSPERGPPRRGKAKSVRRVSFNLECNTKHTYEEPESLEELSLPAFPSPQRQRPADKRNHVKVFRSF